MVYGSYAFLCRRMMQSMLAELLWCSDCRMCDSLCISTASRAIDAKQPSFRLDLFTALILTASGTCDLH